MNDDYIYHTPGIILMTLKEAQDRGWEHIEIEHPYTILPENFQDMYVIGRLAAHLNLHFNAEVDRRFPLRGGEVFHVTVTGRVADLITYVRQVSNTYAQVEAHKLLNP